MAAAAPRLQVLAAAALFSTGGAAIKATALTSWQVACFRSAVAALALGLLLPASRRGWNRWTAAIGVAYAAALVCYALSNKLTTAASSIFLQSTAPLYILLLAPWLLGERLRRRDLAFLGVIAVGLGLVFVDLESPGATAPDPLAGNLLALGAGLSWALVVLGLRWMGRSEGAGDAPLAAVACGNLIAFAVALPMALPVERAGVADGAWILYLGVVQIAFAYRLLTRGLSRVPAVEASLLLLVEPVLNPLWAWWLHAERPSAWALAGGVVIVGAIAAKVVADRA